MPGVGTISVRFARLAARSVADFSPYCVAYLLAMALLRSPKPSKSKCSRIAAKTRARSAIGRAKREEGFASDLFFFKRESWNSARN